MEDQQSQAILFRKHDNTPITFFMEPTGGVRQKVKKLVESRGGLLLDSLHMAYRENLIQLVKDYEIALKRDYDVFDYKYVENCVASNKILPNLIEYRTNQKSIYIMYNPIDVMLGNKKWSDIERVPEGSKVDDSGFDIEVFQQENDNRYKNFKDGKLNYTRAEEMQILKRLIELREFRGSGNAIWKRMERSGVCNSNRSWESMRNRFLRYIRPNIRSFELDEKIVKKFLDPTSSDSSDDEMSVSKIRHAASTRSKQLQRQREEPISEQKQTTSRSSASSKESLASNKENLVPNSTEAAKISVGTNSDDLIAIKNVQAPSRIASSDAEEMLREAGCIAGRGILDIGTSYEIEKLIDETRVSQTLLAESSQNDMLDDPQNLRVDCPDRKKRRKLYSEKDSYLDFEVESTLEVIPSPVQALYHDDDQLSTPVFAEGLRQVEAGSTGGESETLPEGGFTSTQNLESPSPSSSSDVAKQTDVTMNEDEELSHRTVRQLETSGTETRAKESEKLMEEIFGVERSISNESNHQQRLECESSEPAQSQHQLADLPCDSSEIGPRKQTQVLSQPTMENLPVVPHVDTDNDDMFDSSKEIDDNILSNAIYMGVDNDNLPGVSVNNDEKQLEGLLTCESKQTETTEDQPSGEFVVASDEEEAGIASKCSRNASVTQVGMQEEIPLEISDKVLEEPIQTIENPNEINPVDSAEIPEERHKAEGVLTEDGMVGEDAEDDSQNEADGSYIRRRIKKPRKCQKQYASKGKTENVNNNREKSQAISVIVKDLPSDVDSSDIELFRMTSVHRGHVIESADNENVASKTTPRKQASLHSMYEDMVMKSPNTACCSSINTASGRPRRRSSVNPNIQDVGGRAGTSNTTSYVTQKNRKKSSKTLHIEDNEFTSSDESQKSPGPTRTKRKLRIISTKNVIFDGMIRQSERAFYDNREDRAILAYFLDHGGYSNIGGNRVWMAIEKEEICPGRSWHSLKSRFRVILKKLHVYGVSEDQLKEADNDLNDFEMSVVRNGKTVIHYTPEEDKAILNYISETKRYDETKGNVLWKMMEANGVLTNRTWASMKERFMKVILRKLEMYDLPEEQVQRFRNPKSTKEKKERRHIK